MFDGVCGMSDDWDVRFKPQWIKDYLEVVVLWMTWDV